MTDVTFTIACTMQRRWAEQFRGALEAMQKLGNQGSSRNVTLFADGDGDFRPRFSIDDAEIAAAAPTILNGDLFFDAG